MPDYVSQHATHTAARGFGRIGNDGLEVTKVKPSGVDHDDQYGWAAGDPNPRVIVAGRATPETITLTCRLMVARDFFAAHPNYRDEDFSFQWTYESPKLGSITYNQGNCSIKSIKATESDGASTSEALLDIELMPLSVEVGGVTLVKPTV